MYNEIEILTRIKKIERELERLRSFDVPAANTVSNPGLNADMLDGRHAGNASGNIPISNGTLNTNLNADMLDGVHYTAPVSYGPTWGCTSGAAPVLGNGSLTGLYVMIGKLCIVQTRLVAGSTTTFGGGAWYITLPFNPAIDSIGPAYGLDAGTTHYRLIARCNTGTNQTLFSADTGSNVVAAFPWTWATNDQLLFGMAYITV